MCIINYCAKVNKEVPKLTNKKKSRLSSDLKRSVRMSMNGWTKRTVDTWTAPLYPSDSLKTSQISKNDIRRARRNRDRTRKIKQK